MIIWGSKVRESRIGAGTFFCPYCAADRPYTHKRMSRYFTLYFIPLFPTSTLAQYVECGKCGTQLADTFLGLTPEEARAAVGPWICPLCNNRNPSSHDRCVSCGGARSLPASAAQRGSPSLAGNAPQGVARGPSRRTFGLVLRFVLIGVGLLVVAAIGLLAVQTYQLTKRAEATHRPSSSSYLYTASRMIGPRGSPASGNSREAGSLAAKLAAAMTTIREEHFTESSKKSLIDQGDTLKVYCDLRPDQCVFLLHLPELRHFEEDARTAMGNYAWNAAQAVLKRNVAPDEPLRLAVGLQGAVSFERVMIGSYSPDGGEGAATVPEVERGFGCERRLAGWLVATDTNGFVTLYAKGKPSASQATNE
jgi:hypothetical protein